MILDLIVTVIAVMLCSTYYLAFLGITVYFLLLLVNEIIIEDQRRIPIRIEERSCQADSDTNSIDSGSE